MQSEQINELATALAAAQGMMKNPSKNKTAKITTKTGSQYQYKYGDLADIFDAVREPLSKNGLSCAQMMERVLVGDANGTELFLRTVLYHKSGQWLDTWYPLPNGAMPQEFGSALTYGRRYSLSTIVGVAAEDDDDAQIAQNIKTLDNAPGGKKLSDDQKEQIKLYTSELPSDRQVAFLNWLNVKSIDDIRAHQYDRAIGRLQKVVGPLLGEKPDGEADGEAPPQGRPAA